MTVQLTPSDFLDTIEALTKLENAINSGGGGSALTLTDGVHTVADVAQITVSGGTVGGSSPDATLTVGGGSGSASLPLPFFGLTGGAPWVRPSLDIGGPSTAFNTWLNQGGQVYSLGAAFTNLGGHGLGPPAAPGINYSPGDIVTIAGGVGTAAVLKITDTQLVSATIITPGMSGTPGSAQVIGTTGMTGDFNSQFFVLNVTIGGGGGISSIDSIAVAGDYLVNPTVQTAEPVNDNSSSGITGAVVSVVMGALAANPTAVGVYTINPSNPASQSGSSGSGTGATWNLQISDFSTVTDGAGGLPLVVSSDYLATPSGANFSLGLLSGVMKPLGGAPWTVTVGAAMSAIGSTTYVFSTPIILYDSTTGKAVTLSWGLSFTSQSPYPLVTINHYATANAPAGAVSVVSGPHQLTADYFAWFRIQNDGTNLTFSFSAENVAYLPFYTESATALTSSFDYVGFGIERSQLSNNGAGLSTGLTPLWNFTQTSP